MYCISRGMEVNSDPRYNVSTFIIIVIVVVVVVVVVVIYCNYASTDKNKIQKTTKQIRNIKITQNNKDKYKNRTQKM
jgi:uncharacterized membrane protein (DUF106 family)